MTKLVRFSQILLAFLFVTTLLLRPLPVAAQRENGAMPTEERAQLALYLPLALAHTPTSQPAANPLTVAVTVDATRVATKTIPIEGGSLSVTATNGTRYTLTIPADALLSDEEIRMTPLDAAAGMPMRGGLVAGVQLEPDGLWLLHAATLSIENAPSFDASLQVAGFGYQEAGKEFHLRPVTPTESGFQVTLNHFSGYGVTAGTAQEMQKQVAEHAPTAPDDAARQQMYEEIGTPDELQAWFEGQLLDDLEAGRGGDIAALERSIFYFQAWLGMIKELGLEAEFAEMIDLGWKHLLIGLGNAIDFGYVACKEGDASQVVKILRWSRIVRMLPAEPRRVWLSDKWVNTTMTQQAMGCATFELDFDSTLAQDVPGVPAVGQAHDSHLRAENVRVQFNLNAKLAAPSQAPLVYKSFALAGSISGCTPELQMENGTFNLIDARINLNYNWGERPELYFRFEPGHPAETITHHCPQGVTLVFAPRFWNTGFWMMHWGELHTSKEYFEFSSWNFVGKSLYAELIKEVPASGGTLHYHGTTWMVLAHAPE